LTTTSDPGLAFATIVGRRSQRLVAALSDLGVVKDETLAVLCCVEHTLDQAVAESAAATLGCSIFVLSELSSDMLKKRLTELRPAFLLACPEGTATWLKTGVPCRVIGDEGAMFWWKAFELRVPQK
jgi:acyl-coenzyme A synthetase/AMP-(fatty) acid ligase